MNFGGTETSSPYRAPLQKYHDDANVPASYCYNGEQPAIVGFTVLGTIPSAKHPSPI